MRKRTLSSTFFSALLLAAAPAALAQEGADEAAATAPQQGAIDIAEAVRESLVRVEVTLKYDRGEAPGMIAGEGSPAQFISQERPAEFGGFVLSPTQVIFPDLRLNPRFIDSIHVRHGEQHIAAEQSRTAVHQSAVVLELAQPLQNVQPLAFDASAAGPYYTVNYLESDGQWATYVGPLWTSIALTDSGEELLRVRSASLIVNKEGVPVGMAFNEEVPAESGWKGSPLSWELISAVDLADAARRIEDHAGDGVLRVSLSFRSPDQAVSAASMLGPSEQAETEWNGPGVLLDDNTVLVLANLKPQTTARLERIRIYQADASEPTEAEFEATLADYGALLAKTQEPVRGAVVLSGDHIADLRNEVLIEAQVRIQGQSRTDYYQHQRIATLTRGWKRHLYPDVYAWDDHARFFFSTEGQLVALPVERRQKVSVEERWNSDGAQMTPVIYISDVLANLEENIDANNIPLSEEEENRIAWLGVELQPLDEELARMNDVAAETQDGMLGGMVTYVYEGSPAARAGLEMGDILLRMHVEGHPKPLDVDLSSDRFTFGFMEQFPWDQLDQVPEQYFDQIPQPWPPVSNSFNQKLTQIGFDTDYELEFVRGGEKMTADLDVEQSPPYYASAPKFESEDLGLTVKQLTYEVRRYFQRAEDDPGLIVSRIEPGSKASISGLKPYEIITHINDTPMATVADFERIVKQGGELRVSVKRMARGRIIKMDLAASTADDATDDPVETDDDTGAGDGGGGGEDNL